MNVPRSAKTHWLRGNARESTPRQLIVLDTESSQTSDEKRELHTLRCWVARVIVRGDPAPSVTSCVQREGGDRTQLTDLVEATVRSKGTWRLFTHNLSYDLGLTRLPLDLIDRGWSLGRHNLASDSPWAYLKKGSRGLWLCDSFSWLPTSVEKLGEAQGIAKPKLPTELDDIEVWMNRCRADVEILSNALLELMTEWDRRELGFWSVTGPASGWNTMLHFPRRGKKTSSAVIESTPTNPKGHGAGERVLIEPDPVARAFERAALYSGRRDVWRVGKITGGPFAEVDLKQAHLSICANLPLPYRRWDRFDRLELNDWRLARRAAGVVAEVVVNCPAPRYPVRVRGVVLHPVGRFQTVLAGPEIEEAESRGELESVGAGYGYHLGTVMQPWAQWALGVVNSDQDEVAPTLKMAVRSWGRTVPGRWGMTHAKALQSGESHVQGWELEPITLGSPPRRGYIFHCAGRWTESVSDEEADDSFPAVLAYIQSYCRLTLNKMLDALPETALVSCNTEGAWVADGGLRRVCGHGTHTCGNTCTRSDGWTYAMPDLSRATAPLEVRIKQTARTLKVLSPQHHQTDQARLYSGIPKAALELHRDQFTFWTWPKLKGQIEHGDPRGYVRERRTVNLAGVPNSRWCFQDGSTEPVEVTYAPETGNVIQKPSEAILARHGPLRPLQHPVLRRVLN